MTQVGIALDDIVEIEDFSQTTMRALAARLEQSTEFQEMITREIELDELWRRLETGIKSIANDPSAADRRRTMLAIFDLVWQAHDLAGAGQALESARRLRQASALHTTSSS